MSAKIYHNPTNWKDLEKKVAALLIESGYKSAEKRIIETVRSKREIDVYAEQIIDGRSVITLCECKFWEENVSQTIVDAFLTVIANTGANIGYIISKNGFQSGAKEAAKFTNIKLLTWKEFQNEFFSGWYNNTFKPTITDIIKTDYDYLEFYGDDIEDERKEEFYELCRKYNVLHEIRDVYTAFFDDNYRPIDYPIELPLSKSLLKNKADWEKQDYYSILGNKLLEEICYSDFLKELSVFAKDVYDRLETLNIPKYWERDY